MPWAKLGDLLGGDVHHRLDDGALGGQDDDFIVDIVEGWTDAVGVTHGVGLATTRLTAHDEAPVPEGSTLAQDVRQVDTLLDVVGDIHAREAVGTALIEETLDLAVKAVPKLLQEDVHVGDVARMLADGGNSVEDVSDIREVEVTADGEALSTPVAAADHGVHVGQATLARRAIAQVSHEAGASEG